MYIDDGRDPAMTVHEQSTGKERDWIPLKDYNSEAALVGLMDKLGFQKRTKKELERYQRKQRHLQEKMDVENEKRAYDEALRMHKKKDEIAQRVLKMMEENLKKTQKGATEIKV